LDDLDSALVTFRAVAAMADKNPRKIDAAFRVGDCLAARGDLDGAREEYARLMQGNLPAGINEKAAYKLAEVTFWEGKFEQAKESFDQLVVDFPQGFFVNDALMQSMFLEEGLAADQKALEAYVSALRLAQRREYQRALEVFGQARDSFSTSALGDDMFLQIALLHEKLGRHQEALADLEQMLSEFPQSRLCPHALQRMGEIYELGDLPRARAAYQQVLSDYPRYLFLNEVRRKLRQLEAKEAS
jgi:TolA-binding protein